MIWGYPYFWKHPYIPSPNICFSKDYTWAPERLASGIQWLSLFIVTGHERRRKVEALCTVHRPWFGIKNVQ